MFGFLLTEICICLKTIFFAHWGMVGGRWDGGGVGGMVGGRGEVWQSETEGKGGPHLAIRLGRSKPT